MNKYLCKMNFLDGKDGKGKLVQCQKGQPYPAEGREISDERIKELLGKGLIVSQADITFEELEVLEKKIKAAKAELAELQGQLKMKKESLQGPEQNELEQDETGSEELGEDEEFHEEEIEGETPEAPKKKVKVKKKKNR